MFCWLHTGKTSLARTLAGLAGQELVELALNGGTDTSDLLGGFEQLEPSRRLQVSLSSQQHIMPEVPIMSFSEKAPQPLPARDFPNAKRRCNAIIQSYWTVWSWEQCLSSCTSRLAVCLHGGRISRSLLRALCGSTNICHKLHRPLPMECPPPD